MAPNIIREHPNAVRTGAVGAVLLAVVAFLALHTSRQPPPHQAPTITMVMIQPPKPPPPPPPLPQPKMVVQPKMTVPTVKPMIPNQPAKAAPPKAPAPAAVPMGTSIHNNGPADAFNLSGTPGGNGFLGGGGGGGGGSRWGYYAEQVQPQIQAALQRNRTTRHAAAGVGVQIWADASGNVTRVELIKASGNPAIDDAVRNDVLSHMRFPQPPADMPMPIVLSLTGQSNL